MKIITSDAVYVQKNDLGFLTHTDFSIPVSIFMKVFGNYVTIIDDSNRYEFVKFEEKSEIDFFKNLDFIVDYDSVKDLDESQMVKLIKSTFKQKRIISKSYNSMSSEDRVKNSYMIDEYEKLDFKTYSLRDILWFKQGHLQFILPEGIEYPKTSKKVYGKGLRRILSKFKTNNTNL